MNLLTFANRCLSLSLLSITSYNSSRCFSSSIRMSIAISAKIFLTFSCLIWIACPSSPMLSHNSDSQSRQMVSLSLSMTSDTFCGGWRCADEVEDEDVAGKDGLKKKLFLIALICKSCFVLSYDCISLFADLLVVLCGNNGDPKLPGDGVASCRCLLMASLGVNAGENITQISWAILNFQKV